MILKTPLHNSNYIMLTRLDSNTVPLIYYAFAYLGGYKITSPCRAMLERQFRCKMGCDRISKNHIPFQIRISDLRAFELKHE